MIGYETHNSRAESRLVLDYLITTFTPVTIIPFVYSGALAAHELLTYAATKLYFALRFELSHYTVIPVVNCVTYDDSNVQKSAYLNTVMTYDTVAAIVKYSSNTFMVNDIWFSRIVTAYSYVNFIGYKLTY